MKNLEVPQKWQELAHGNMIVSERSVEGWASLKSLGLVLPKYVFIWGPTQNFGDSAPEPVDVCTSAARCGYQYGLWISLPTVSRWLLRRRRWKLGFTVIHFFNGQISRILGLFTEFLGTTKYNTRMTDISVHYGEWQFFLSLSPAFPKLFSSGDHFY
jgi:hypothetical protein